MSDTGDTLLPPLPDGIPEAAVMAYFDEYGSANIDAVQAGLTGWQRERYAITAGLAAALQRIGCGSLYDGPMCPCYQAGLTVAGLACRLHDDPTCPCYQAGLDDADCTCRDPSG